MNTIILIGNLEKDPIMSHTPENVAVTKFTVADSAQKRRGEPDKTTWYNVIAWRGQAETAARFLHKGSKVYVQGVLDVREYTRDDGTKGIALDVTADKIQFLDAPTSAASGAATSPTSTPDDGNPF